MKKKTKEHLVAEAEKQGYTCTQIKPSTLLDLNYSQTINTNGKDVVLLDNLGLIVDGKNLRMEIMFYEVSDDAGKNDKIFSASQLGLTVITAEDGEIEIYNPDNSYKK